MALSREDHASIVTYVRDQPRSVQEIATHIKRSWVTAERYVEQIIALNGEIGMRTFRKGSRSAIKIVYYAVDALPSERIEEMLFTQILTGRYKTDFDILDLAYHANGNVSTHAIAQEEHLRRTTKQIENTRSNIMLFSGNLSFTEHESIRNSLEQAIRRGVRVSILSRITAGTLANLERLPEGCEVRHTYQPLRGTITDTVTLTGFEDPTHLKSGELNEPNVTIFTTGEERWVSFCERVFWAMWRSAPDAGARIKLLNNP